MNERETLGLVVLWHCSVVGVLSPPSCHGVVFFYFCCSFFLKIFCGVVTLKQNPPYKKLLFPSQEVILEYSCRYGN